MVGEVLVVESGAGRDRQRREPRVDWQSSADGEVTTRWICLHQQARTGNGRDGVGEGCRPRGVFPARDDQQGHDGPAAG